MAEEVLKRDQNFVVVLGGVTNDVEQEVRMLRVDPLTGRLLVSASGSGIGTVTSLTASTGILLTPNPITTTGTIGLSTALSPIATLSGNSLKFLRVNSGETAVEYATVSTTLTVGTTPISSGTNGRVLYDNAGILGEMTTTGSGTVLLLATSPTITTPTLSGAMTLEENAAILLDPALSADGKYNGITRAGTAGATLAFGDLIYLDPTDSRWELADANSAAGADGDARATLGICVLAAAADGSATNVLLYGTVRADAVFPSMTINSQIYVSETAGDITGTQPTTSGVVIRVVGQALTADELLFNPSPDFITHA